MSRDPVCPAESSADGMRAVTAETRRACRPRLPGPLLLGSDLLVQIHLCIYHCPSLLKVHLNSTATALLTIYSNIRTCLVPTPVLEFHINRVYMRFLRFLSIIRQTKPHLRFQAAFPMAPLFSLLFVCFLFLVTVSWWYHWRI